MGVYTPVFGMRRPWGGTFSRTGWARFVFVELGFWIGIPGGLGLRFASPAYDPTRTSDTGNVVTRLSGSEREKT